MNWLCERRPIHVTRSSLAASPSLRATAVLNIDNGMYFCFRSRATKLWTLHIDTERIEANTLKELLVLWKLKR